MVHLVLFLSIGSCLLTDDRHESTSGKTIEDRSDDLGLREAVQKAIKKRPSPEQIEQLVGVAALWKTTQPSQRAAIRATSIVADEEMNKTIPRLKDMKHVVLWNRPRHPFKVLIVCWDEADVINIYYGVIIP
jgi:hypothetical protein